ncbi:MAG: ATP-binding protein [Nitrospinaceae bacterium]
MAVLVAGLIFGLDRILPLGVADGVLYVALVLIGLRSRSQKLIVWGALAGSVLTVIGFYLSPSEGEIWKAVANRALGVFTIWMTAFLCLWQIRVGSKLQKAHDELKKRAKNSIVQLDQTSELLRKESEFVQLHKDIAVASNETRALEDIMEYCLKRICAHAGWPVGHLYLISDLSSKRLVPTRIWYLEDADRFETFRRITEATPFNPGIGLPGRVFSSGKPNWIIDVTKDPNFPRAKLAENIGVKAGFAFPILVGEEIVGVMEFFSSQPVEPDGKMLAIMAQIGTQMGRVIERKQSEDDQEKLLHSLRKRVKELTSMYGVANLVGTSKTMREVFQKVESLIIPGMQYPAITRVKVTFGGETFCPQPFEETPWKLSGDISLKEGSQGRIEVYYTQPTPTADGKGPFLKEEQYMIDGLARFLSVAAERKEAEKEIERSREQLRNLYRRLELVREEERTRIAREIHDELAQVLTTLKLELSLLDKKLLKIDSPLQPSTQMMLGLINDTIQVGKNIVLDLRPPVLDDLGLPEAIEWEAQLFEQRTGIECDLEMDKYNFSLDKERSTTIFRIFQETLTNVTRHAKAEKIYVKLKDQADVITLQVKDNGIGITPSQISNIRSLGLLGMRERALVWEGEVDIQGIPNQGTTVTIKIHRD